MIGKLQAGLTVESWGKTPKAKRPKSQRHQGTKVSRPAHLVPHHRPMAGQKKTVRYLFSLFPSSSFSSLADFPIFNSIHQNGRRADVSHNSHPIYRLPHFSYSSYGLLLATPLCLAVKLINLLQFHCHQARWCPGMKSRLSAPMNPINEEFHRQLSRIN